MKIIGSYSPYQTRTVSNQQNFKTGMVKGKENIAEAKSAKQPEISSEEKQFFVSRYPEQKETVMDYHFYHKSGKMSGVNVGTLLDRRG